MLRRSEVLANPYFNLVQEEAAESGSVYAFLPAHGESRVGAVQQPLSRAWSEDLGLSVLLADLDGSPASLGQPLGDWMESARRRYDVVTADLTRVPEELGLEVMHSATSIFIVSDSDRESLELARDKAAWIGSHGMEDRCGLLLRGASAGMRPDLAEDFTGIPVCSLIDTTLQIKRLAAWLTPDVVHA